MVWVGRAQGHRGMGRVYGPDYMLAMCRLSVTRGYRNFLYGGKTGVADMLRVRLEAKFLGIQIVGTYTPPFGPLAEAEGVELAERIARCKPDILWVGLSTPKQEQFMAKHLRTLDVRLMAGVGAAFDIHAGMVTDSPDWIKCSGLQWLDRLRREPRRLWRRYLRNNPAFVWEMALQMAGVNRFSID